MQLQAPIARGLLHDVEVRNRRFETYDAHQVFVALKSEAFGQRENKVKSQKDQLMKTHIDTAVRASRSPQPNPEDDFPRVRVVGCRPKNRKCLRKTFREDVAGRRGRKAGPEDVLGRIAGEPKNENKMSLSAHMVIFENIETLGNVHVVLQIGAAMKITGLTTFHSIPRRLWLETPSHLRRQVFR